MGLIYLYLDKIAFRHGSLSKTEKALRDRRGKYVDPNFRVEKTFPKKCSKSQISHLHVLTTPTICQVFSVTFSICRSKYEPILKPA